MHHKIAGNSNTGVKKVSIKKELHIIGSIIIHHCPFQQPELFPYNSHLFATYVYLLIISRLRYNKIRLIPFYGVENRTDRGSITVNHQKRRTYRIALPYLDARHKKAPRRLHKG